MSYDLETMTGQEVFDVVATHLLTQKKRSMGTNRGSYDCAYHGEGGLKCAAGIFIPDEKYRLNLEGVRWIGLMMDKVVPDAHYRLISDLQAIHDRTPPSHWGHKLKEFADTEQFEFSDTLEQLNQELVAYYNQPINVEAKRKPRNGI